MSCVVQTCVEAAIPSGMGVRRRSLWLYGLGRVREWKWITQVGHGDTGQGGWTTVVTVEPGDADGLGALVEGKTS